MKWLIALILIITHHRITHHFQVIPRNSGATKFENYHVQDSRVDGRQRSMNVIVERKRNGRILSLNSVFFFVFSRILFKMEMNDVECAHPQQLEI